MPNRKTIIKRSILCKIISCTLLPIVSAVCLYGCGDVKKNIKKDVEKHSMIYGLTIDDAWYDDIALKDVVRGLKNLKARPTVRIVISKKIRPAVIEIGRASCRERV